jgi:hypothetical protein
VISVNKIVIIIPLNSLLMNWRTRYGYGDMYIFLFMISAFISCNQKPREGEKTSPYFKINGVSLERDFSNIPDSLDNEVYKINLNIPVNFDGPQAVSPDENKWYIDGILIEKGKTTFEHQFEYPGVYQIKHCHGLTDCAIRYVFVPHPVSIIEEPAAIVEAVQATEIIDYEPPKPKKEKKKSQELVPTVPVTPEELNEPAKVDPKPVMQPPKSFKNTLITGFSSETYKSDCVKWVESGSVKLKPKEFCLLHSAVIYSNAKGKVRITLTDGVEYNESMSVVLTAGKTQFAFSDLIPVLFPDRIYTLTINTLVGTDSVKPKIGNIASCSASPKITPLLLIDYLGNEVLFDINYRVK